MPPAGRVEPARFRSARRRTPGHYTVVARGSRLQAHGKSATTRASGWRAPAAVFSSTMLSNKEFREPKRHPPDVARR
ncbi:hypothetical protein PJI17_21315 [Mycobacterium kansasii]